MMEMNRREFLSCATSAAALVAVGGCRTCVAEQDAELAVLLSDIHISGRKMGESDVEEWMCQTYQHEKLRVVVDEILAMRPRPAKCICFGDLAHDRGCDADYEVSYAILRPLEDAGIEIVHGLGNHDHREPFLRKYSEYAKRTPVPGRAVSIVEFPSCDFVMMDTLQEHLEPEWNGWNAVDGTLDEAQRAWLLRELPKRARPFFLASHHPVQELWIRPKSEADKKGLRLDKFLVRECPRCAGYIHGHNHSWKTDWVMDDWGKPDMLRTLCLPSTGDWGDIGWTSFRMSEHAAVASLHLREFYFPQPGKAGEKRPWEWDEIVAEKTGSVCTFKY